MDLWGKKISTTQIKPLYLCWNPTEIKSSMAATAQGARWLKATQGASSSTVICHRYWEVFCGIFAQSNLHTGKINSKWGMQPLGWGQWWRGEDSWEQWGSRGRKAMRTQRPVACTAKTSKSRALYRYPKWSHTLCKDTGRPPVSSRATWTQASKAMTSLSSKMTSKNLMGNKSNSFP